MMKLRNLGLGHGVYAIGDSGWTVERDDLNSAFIWTVHDAHGKELLYYYTRKGAVERAVKLLDALNEEEQ